MKPRSLWACTLLLLSFLKAEAADPAAWSDVYLGYRPSDTADRIIQAYWTPLFNAGNIPMRDTFHFTVFHGSAFPVKCKVSSKKTYVYCQKSQNAVDSDGLNTALYNTYDHVLTEQDEELTLSMGNSKILKSGDFDETTLSGSDKFFLVLNFDSENKNKIHKLNVNFRKAIDQNELGGKTFPSQSEIDEEDDDTIYIVSNAAKEAVTVEGSNIAGKTTKVAPICCYKTAAPNMCINLSEGSKLRMDRLSCFIVAANKFYTLKDQSEYHITLADYLLARERLRGEEGNVTDLQRSKILLKKFNLMNSQNQVASRNSNPLIGGDVASPEVKASALRGIYSFRNQMFRDADLRTKILAFLKRIHKDKAKAIKGLFQNWDRTIARPDPGEERELPASFAPFREILEEMMPDDQEDVSVWAVPYTTVFDTSDKLLGWLNSTEITFPFNGDTRHHNP